jgi:hypothetical protein
MTIKIIDDVIPLSIQNDIENVVSDARFPWHFIPSSDLSNLANENYVTEKREFYQNMNIIDPPQFFQNILNDQAQPTFFFQWFTPLLDSIKFEGMKILRMKMNFNYPYLNSNSDSHGIPHVDLPLEENYTTCVYYVTDADGDTILFNEKNGYKGILSVQTRVSPKKGRIVLFDGNTLHAACPPQSDNKRIVLNINLK